MSAYLPALFGGLAFAVGITMGRRISDATHIQHHLAEAFERDEDVLNVADMATDSSE